MLFGRQRNMVRRKYRPHESYHRDMRRKGLDRSVMLEASRGTRRKQPWIVRAVGAIVGLFSGGRRR